MRLAKYVKLDDVFKIRACYFAVKTDASMIIRIDEESTVGDMTNVRNEVTTLGEFFCGTQTIWLQNIKHTEQMKKYIKITFYHITDNVSEANWNIEHKNVDPSDYLNI